MSIGEITHFLHKYNVDTEIIAELEFYENNSDNENVYQELLNNFNIDSELEATVLLSIIEVKKLVEQELENTIETTICRIDPITAS